MRRSLAVLAACCVLTHQAQTFAFHVHATSVARPGIDDHRHGPAIHHHRQFGYDEERHVGVQDSPDAGTVITVAVPAATAIATVLVAVAVRHAIATPDLQLIGDVRAIDVRSHGPPVRSVASLRGPPSSTFL